MGAVGAAHPAGQAWWQQADGERARGGQWPDVCSEHRLSVASDPEGLAAAKHRLRLLRPLGLGRHARRIHYALYEKCRELAEREASPTAAIIDSQSVKSAEKGGAIDPSGYDAGKKIKGKKRHILVDTQGLLMHAIVHAADVQDRDGGVLLMASLFGAFRF